MILESGPSAKATTSRLWPFFIFLEPLHMTSNIVPQLPTITVFELHAMTLELISKGHGTLPVCTTDGRARFPFQAYPAAGQLGDPDALLICPRPDAHFLPVVWPAPDAHACKTSEWNAIADEMKAHVAPFQAPAALPDDLTTEQLLALERFAAKYGASWKSDLSAAWASGKDERLPDGALLRQVRNQLGPEWLEGFNGLRPTKG